MSGDPRPRREAPAQPGASDQYASAIWTATIWGCRRRSLDRLATLTTLLLLLASRFALLPSGPWEWDETLFARGLLRFDLHAHFPHPPGFPLWILLGKAVLPLVSDSLQALQLLSALASCLTLWPLAAIGRRVAPAPVAAAAAVALLAAPGTWLHAVRGFSSTPAAFFALWAAALAVYGLAGQRVTAFTLLVTAAFLVRPILLPPLAILWLAGAAPVRPLRRLLPGLLLGVLAVAAAVVGMIVAQGDATRFVQAFVTHGATHARNLVLNVGGLTDLGLVKGLGGLATSSGVLVLAILGARRWHRAAGGRSVIAWFTVLAVGIGEIVWLQNRTFSRYAVPFQLALAPLGAAGAAAAAGPPIAAAGMLGLAALFAWQAAPAVREQHDRPMPGWEAIRTASSDAARRRLELVVEPGLYPFLSYLEENERRRGAPWSFDYHLAPSSPDAQTAPQGPYLLVTDFPHRYLDPPLGRTLHFGGVTAALRPLTQQRFLKAAVIEGAPLPLSGWWAPETGRDGERFMWGAPGASLLLPPYPRGTAVQVDLCPSRGPAPVALVVNSKKVEEIPGELQRRRTWIEPGMLSATRTNTIRFERAAGYPPGPSDPRPLAIRLYSLRAISPALPWGGPIADAAQRQALHIFTNGVSGPENFKNGRGAWTDEFSRLRLPAGPGTLTLTVWAPRPAPPDLEVFAGSRRLRGPVKVWKKATEIEIDIPPEVVSEDGVELTLHATPYFPARAGNPRDPRRLGIVLGAVRYTPSAATAREAGWLAAGS